MKTYVRLDASVTKLIGGAAQNMVPVSGHYVNLYLHPCNVYDNHALCEWLKGLGPASVEFGPSHHMLRLSLSQIPEKGLDHLDKYWKEWYIPYWTESDGVSKPTGNPLLVTIGDKLYRVKPAQPSLEDEYYNRLDGLDMYYAYSDSTNVYKNGERRLKELQAEYREKGLSDTTTHRLTVKWYRDRE